jgi:O-antigen ligase
METNVTQVEAGGVQQFVNRRAQIALRIVQIGALAVVLVATTLHAFELDRFFVPKELVLHLTALLAGMLVARATASRVDRLLALFLLLSALSAIFAPNPWLAMRALAISASSVVLFWTARGLREAGLGAPLVRGLALAVIATAVTSLLQTYGLDLDFFSEQRAPGGTLGNRNFVAHVAAFGFPLVLFCALRARRYWLWSAGAAIIVASLVLTRSRAAWLAFAAVLVVFLATLLFTRQRVLGRLAGIALASAVAVGAVLVLPNSLHWRSDNPYLETMKRVTDYESGSGHGRLVQYERSLNMALHHPLLGAGAGNWAVVYPAFAPRSDPSMNDSQPGMTFNPWPSSDWIAAISERGPVAAVLLGLVFLALFFRKSNDGLERAALLATITGALVAGLFDAVLLLAIPAFLVWTALGALSSPDEAPRRQWIVILVLLVSVLGIIRSASQLIAMQIYVSHSDRAALARAAKIDPGNFRLQVRLARGGPRKQRCEHARAARGLYPHAVVAKRLGCD